MDHLYYHCNCYWGKWGWQFSGFFAFSFLVIFRLAIVRTILFWVSKKDLNSCVRLLDFYPMVPLARFFFQQFLLFMNFGCIPRKMNRPSVSWSFPAHFVRPAFFKEHPSEFLSRYGKRLLSRRETSAYRRTSINYQISATVTFFAPADD